MIAAVTFGGPVRHAQPGSWRRWCACGVRLTGATREIPYHTDRSWSAVMHQPCGCVWEGPVWSRSQRGARGRLPGRRWRDAPHQARRLLAGYDPVRDRRRSPAEPRMVVVTGDGTLLGEDDQGQLVERGQVSRVEIRHGGGLLRHAYGLVGSSSIWDQTNQGLYVRLYSAGPDDGPTEVLEGEGYARQAITFWSAADEVPSNQQAVTFGSPESWGTVQAAVTFDLGVLLTEMVDAVTDALAGLTPEERAALEARAGLAENRLAGTLDPEDLEAVPDYDHEQTRARLAAVEKTLDEAAAWEARWEDQAHRHIPEGRYEGNHGG